ncbi:MAG: hypothetical protein ACLFSW_05690 [Halobacteriales archaeon]
MSEESLSGHVWVQELFTGEPLRFRVASSGFVEFGTHGEVFGADVPLRFRAAARCVREQLDRSALRGSVEDTESVTFLGTATVYKGLEYDWSALPAFVGVDVWSDKKEAYLTPDAASSAYSSLGLAPLPAFEKETDAERAPIGAYTSGDLPESRFRYGPAAGVLVRDKSGGRGEVRIPMEGETVTAPEEVVSRYVTEERVRNAVEEVGTADDARFEKVLGRVTERMVRERYADLYKGGGPAMTEREIRSTVAESVRRYL